jgi:hypothetical protein
MRRALLLAAVVVGAAAPAPASAAPVTVTAVLLPQAVFFADRVQAQVSVVVDTRAVDPARATLSAPLGIWTQLGAMHVQTTRAGQLARRRWSFTIACRVTECLPASGVLRARLPPAVVRLVAPDGSTRSVAVRWPGVDVAARVSTAAASLHAPPFRLQTTPPAARPSVSSALVAALLDAAAALLAVAALTLVVFEFRRRRPHRGRVVSPFERALALAREAQSRPGPDRRRALALLARIAAGRDPGLSTDVGAAAWERPEPDPDRIAELVRRAERLEDAP